MLQGTSRHIPIVRITTTFLHEALVTPIQVAGDTELGIIQVGHIIMEVEGLSVQEVEVDSIIIILKEIEHMYPNAINGELQPYFRS